MTADPLAGLEELTRAYARYSRSAGGLSAVIGGVLGLVSFAIGGVGPSSPTLRAVLVLIPLAWLIARQLIARHYYQRLGHVTERAQPREQRNQRLLTAGVVIVCCIIVLGWVIEHQPLGLRAWTWSGAGYVVALLVTPLVVWRWLHTPLDLVVGVFLLSQAALALAGTGYPWWGSATVFAVAALLLIASGIADHRRFRAVDAELRAITGARAPAP